MTVEFVTSVGRIVWGNPAKSTIKKDQNTKQPVIRDGKQVEQWAFGIAFPKAEFGQYVLPYLQQAVAAVFPHGVPPAFSWKIKDGDGVDRQGKPYNTREGYAGNYILTVSTEAFAPPIYKNEGGRYRQMAENEIKTGDYVVVKLNVKANQPTNASHTPGLYINPMGIEHVGYGQEILGSSADPDEMFGGRTYQLPPGASAAPVAPVSNVAAPYNAGAPANYGQPAPAAAPVNYAPQPAPAAYMPPPATDFVNAAMGQPAGAPANYGQPAPAAAPANYGQPGVMPGR